MNHASHCLPSFLILQCNYYIQGVIDGIRILPQPNKLIDIANDLPLVLREFWVPRYLLQIVIELQLIDLIDLIDLLHCIIEVLLIEITLHEVVLILLIQGFQSEGLCFLKCGVIAHKLINIYYFFFYNCFRKNLSSSNFNLSSAFMFSYFLTGRI